MRYLIVDDDPVIRTLLVRLLNTSRTECVEASCHAEAMEQIGIEDFEAVFVDVNLGTEDGIDLAIMLRDMRRDLKIIVMSADPSYQERVVEEGLGQMLIKPFTPDEVREILHSDL